MRFECSCEGISQRDSVAFVLEIFPRFGPVIVVIFALSGFSLLIVVLAPPQQHRRHHQPTTADPPDRNPPPPTIRDLKSRCATPVTFLAGNLRLTSSRTKGGPVKISARSCVLVACGRGNIEELEPSLGRKFSLDSCCSFLLFRPSSESDFFFSE